MKKNATLLFFTCLHMVSGHTQNVNFDSLAKVIVQKNIIEKVEHHSDIVKRLEWTSPWFLVPTIVAILGIAYALCLHIWGLKKKADAILETKEFQVKIDNLIESRIAAKEQETKNKPVCIVYLPNKEMRRIPKLLEGAKFKNVTCKTTQDTFDDIQPNTVVIFNDEDGDFTDGIANFINSHASIKSKGRFFYFGSKRFLDKDIRMHNFANSDDTLTVRLYESLTFA